MWRGLFGGRNNRIGISPTEAEDEAREAVPTDGGGAEVRNGVVLRQHPAGYSRRITPAVSMRDELARPSSILTVPTFSYDFHRENEMLSSFPPDHPVTRRRNLEQRLTNEEMRSMWTRDTLSEQRRKIKEATKKSKSILKEPSKKLEFKKKHIDGLESYFTTGEFWRLPKREQDEMLSYAKQYELDSYGKKFTPKEISPMEHMQKLSKQIDEDYTYDAYGDLMSIEPIFEVPDISEKVNPLYERKWIKKLNEKFMDNPKF
jgi:hypothetical protein